MLAICSGYLRLCSKPGKTKRRKTAAVLLRLWILWVGNLEGTEGYSVLFCRVGGDLSCDSEGWGGVKSLRVGIGGAERIHFQGGFFTQLSGTWAGAAQLTPLAPGSFYVVFAV